MIERSPGQDYYRLGPPPPGTIRNAAFGLLTFANVAGDVASIASLFWLAYAESIAPRKKERNSGIFIMIGGTRGTQVWLDSDVLDRNDFAGAFISGVTKEAGSAENAERIYEWQLQIRSGQWIKIERDEFDDPAPTNP